MAAGSTLRARWLAAEHGSRPVTWLELFFDVVFVAAVLQVASPLHHHYDVHGVLRFAVLFVLIWWAWVGHATFATRFDGDTFVQRSLTLLQMFAAAAMAANATDALGSEESAGFAAAYAAMRLVLVGQYFRARRIPGAEGLARGHIRGYGTAALLWLGSAFVPAPWRFVIWALAFAIDLGTPWLTLHHTVAAPPDGEHLPERVGLFTIILLGESVIAVMRGMSAQEGWSVPAASAAVLGLGLTSTIWWAYFERIQAAGARHVTCHDDARRFTVWLFAHLPLYLATVVSAVGMQRSIEAVPGTLLPPGELALVAVGIVCVVLALGVLRLTVARTAGREVSRPSSSPPSWAVQSTYPPTR